MLCSRRMPPQLHGVAGAPLRVIRRELPVGLIAQPAAAWTVPSLMPPGSTAARKGISLS